MHNKRVKRGLLLLFLLFLAVCAFAFFAIKNSCATLNSNYIKRETAILGGALNGSSIEENTILTDSILGKDYEAGAAVLQPYSYNDAPNSSYALYQSLLRTQMITTMIIIAIFFSFAALLYTVMMSKTYGEIRLATNAADKIRQGDIALLPQEGEGDIFALFHSIQNTSQRIVYSMEQLQDEKEYLKDILSDVSHQLKTPLSAIAMYHDILLNSAALEPAKQKEFIEKSAQQLERMDWLIQGLLTLARVESGSVEMHRKMAPLYVTVDIATSPFRHLAIEKGISLIANIPQEIVFSHDPNWVAEAIGNVVKNAIEHTEKGGTVEIKAQQTPMTVELFIKDNGMGIAQEELGKVFQRFYRASNQVDSTHVGIGLALSQQIVQQNNGDIYVSSMVGEGTEFVLTFLTEHKMQ